MLISIAILLGGLLLLALGSDRFVTGAAALARNLGVTPMVVGLTVVALGTSAPEMLVSAMAAYEGNPGLAIGNVLGSNIANITLVLGAGALVTTMVVASQTLRQEFPILLAVTALAWLLCADAELSRTDAGVLMMAMLLVLTIIVYQAHAARRSDPLRQEIDAHAAEDRIPMGGAVGRTVLGLGVLLFGSRLVVVGATDLALAFGVSDLVIGLTVVAVGTSLPEMAATVASALKGEPDIAVGNVLGSNMFNLLPVLAIAGLVQPFTIEPSALERDFPVMAVLTIALFLMCVGWRGSRCLKRLHGGALLSVFVGYQVVLYLGAV